MLKGTRPNLGRSLGARTKFQVPNGRLPEARKEDVILDISHAEHFCGVDSYFGYGSQKLFEVFISFLDGALEAQ